MLPSRIPRLSVALIALITLCSATVAAAQSVSIDSGLAQMQSNRWAAAVATFRPLADENPYDGLLQHYLGMSLSRSGDCAGAMPRLDRAIALGINGSTLAMRQARFTLASCHAARGEADRAIAQLDTAWRRHGLRDFAPIAAGPRFASLAQDPRFKRLAGTPEAPLTDRAALWRFDLAYVDRLVRETHPRPFGHRSEGEWAAAVADLDRRIPELSDDAVIAGLMRLFASVGDGHTALYPPTEGEGAWTLLPIWPVALADGWYIAAAAPEHRALVGGRIVAAGEVPIERLDSLGRMHVAADNEWTARWILQAPLQMAQFYGIAGAAANDGSVTLRVAMADGTERRETVRPRAIDRDPLARWAPSEWPTMAPARGAPRWIANAGKAIAIEWLPQDRVVYVALNVVGHEEERSLLAMAEAVRDTILRRRPVGVVLDLRLNNGGDGNTVPNFLRPLVALPVLHEDDAFRVLIGPRTFSAAMTLLNELNRHTEALTVGWPTGGRPVHIGTETPFRLPMSGLLGSTSARLEVAGRDANDARPYAAPNVAVWPTGADLARGADPVLDAALGIIRSRPR
jgi:hypothetical protein